MKTANVYEIERALQQPITPEQRQTAAANNPVAALIAQRLDGVEGSLRTKLQTPPPPQGTVMNQYYQWPQQQQQMGLAQPGLEEMAQQYAAGGLVAFADGGPVYDYDGGNGYAEGGLASMLPMGYAGEDDVPVFNGYDDGGGVKLHQYPWRTLGESVEPTIVDDNAEDEDAFWEDMPDDAIAGYEKGLDFAKSLPGETAKVNNYLGQKIVDKAKEVGQRWSERLTPYTDKVSELLADRKETQRLEGLPAAYAAAMESGAPMPPVSYEPTVSGEDRKMQEHKDEKTRKAAAHYDALEKPTRARKASVSVPSANPVRSEGPGVSILSPQAWEGGQLGATANYEPSTEMAEAPAGEQESGVNLNPNNNATAAAIVNSPLSADQQIAALAKYFQTDTSEAMRIKGEMEKENAHAGNVGIMAVLANALGMGLGTYGTGAARWGAGLMGAAQGFMSEEDRAARRQAEIDKLRREIAESPSKKHNEAAKMYFDVLREQGKLRSAEDIARAKAIQQQRLAEYNATNKENQFVRSETGKNARTAQMVGAREQAEMNEKMKTAQNLERYYRDSTDYRIATEEERRRRIAEIYAGQGLTPPGAMSSQGMGTRPIITRSGIQSPSAP